MGLASINDVSGAFVVKANKFWWAYQIAWEWSLDPREVKRWDADDILEALAAIGLKRRNMPK